MTHHKRIPEAAIRRAWLDLSTPTHVSAARLGLSRQGLSHRAKTMGLPPRAKAGCDMQKKCSDAEFRRLWGMGVPVVVMARLLGYCTHQAITVRRIALGLPPRTRGRGKGNGRGWRETLMAEDMIRQAMAETAARENAAMREHWAA